MTSLRDIPADWPARDTSQIIATHPHRWHVQIMGTGPDLVLIHGAGASTHSWRVMMPILAQSYRVVAFDLPGQGFSLAGTRSRSSLDLMAQDISRLLRAAEIRPHAIVGHSAGAALALQMMLHDPDLARGVVVINGALENFSGAAGWLFPVMAKLMAMNPLTGLFLGSGMSDRRLIAILQTTGSNPDAETLSYYRHLMRKRSHIEATLAMMAQWTLERLNQDLPRIAAPVLFLHGAKDQAVSLDIAKRAMGAVPHGQLQVLADAGHLLPETHGAEAAAAVTSFLRNLDP
ncbi:alpha/beta fold hydrolase [Rhodobacteraceae bacterium XHP0102]|nr:alpha/beta fold hydrolase [Rhodobacteraceae bacterium XHP0102]